MDGDTLLISGIGEMDYSETEEVPWSSEQDNIKKVIIKPGVTNICSRAFQNCSGLKTIIIPNTVKSIGKDAFWGCDSLDSISIPNSVTYIGDNVFTGCKSLKSITIPNSVTCIGNFVFCNCDSLKKVTIEVNKKKTLLICVNAFSASSIEKLIMNGETILKCVSDEFIIGFGPNTTLYVPSSLYEKYRSTYPWSEFKNVEKTMVK